MEDNEIPEYLFEIWQDGELDIEMEGRVTPNTMRRLWAAIAEQRRRERATPGFSEVDYAAMLGPVGDAAA